MNHATHESKLCKSDCIDGIVSDNVYIYLVYNIALNMSYMNHSRFPSTPPPPSRTLQHQNSHYACENNFRYLQTRMFCL